MAWIESHQSLGRHPKLKAAARSLGISRVQMVGHLHYLWWWALDYAENGDLSGQDMEDIAEEAMWDGDAAEFIEGLISSGFLTTDMQITDWGDYTGRLQAQRESNRARQQRFRDRHKGKDTTGEEGDRDVTVTNALRHGATVPNRTEPYRTQQDPDAVLHEVAREAPAPPTQQQRQPAPPRRQTEMPIPDDFRLTDAMRGFALTLGVTEAEAVSEFGKLVAFAEANDLRKRDWEGYWRWWLQQGVSKGHCGPNRTGNVRQFSARAPASTPQERTKAAFDAVLAEIDGQPPPLDDDIGVIETRGVVT